MNFKLSKNLIGVLLFICFIALSILPQSACGQNYMSINDGNWSVNSQWQNSSGWGNAHPPLSGQGSGTITIDSHITIPEGNNYSIGGSVNMTVNAGSSLTINGNLNRAGGGVIVVHGTLWVTGDASIGTSQNQLDIRPGGKVIIEGSLSILSNQNLLLGNSAPLSSPPVDSDYADLVVKGDLISLSSGDLMVNSNGRMAVWGNLIRDQNSAGVFVTVKEGGQVFIDGNIEFEGNGGGNFIRNENPKDKDGDAFGLYVNGDVNFTGTEIHDTNSDGGIGGLTQLFESNNPFLEWLELQPGAPPHIVGGLPVTLISFKATYIRNEVSLTWTTASEKDNSHFVIQKSNNALDWAEVGRVKGNGNSNQMLHYHYSDRSPYPGLNYYRLKQVDFDGAYEVFAPILVKNEIQISKIELFPNPAFDIVNIDLVGTVSGPYELSVYDFSGQLLIKKVFEGVSPTLDISKIKQGSYILAINTGNGAVLTQKLIKTR